MTVKLVSTQDGQSLVELLVAVAILGLVLGPCLALFAAGRLGVSRADMETVAVNLAREQFETVKALGAAEAQTNFGSGTSGIYVESDLPGFSAFQRITRFEALTLGPPDYPEEVELTLVTVTINWTVKDRLGSLCLAGYVAGP